MILLGKEKIEKFKKKHATSRNSLDRFIALLEACNATNFVELKKTFSAADQVGDSTVFDVGGNKVRVISVVNYMGQQVLVTDVFTHEEYDKKKW
jgi:mRNA interferase HigB